MHAPKEQGRWILQIAAVLSVFAVLVVDLLTPLGVAIWSFYLIAVAFTFVLLRPAAPILVACACSAAIVAGYLFSPPPVPGTSHWTSALNRGLGVVGVWSVALMSRHAILARLRLSAQAWIRAGQRDLGARMQGEFDRHALGDRILHFLCEYLDAPVGVLYVSEGDVLQQAAAYALDPRRSCPREVLHPGEGLLGQAVKSRRPLRLDHAQVPAGHLPVSSALGTSQPRHVVALPAITDSEVTAAMELGFTRPLTDLDMDLLATVSESVAVAVRSCLYRGRLEVLLRETQRQADELQAQQEELRVTNEELEEQRRALTASQAHLEEQAHAVEQHRDQLLRAQAELVARSADLARASQYKSEFLANMSHELRTPLNSALLLARLLADNKDGNLTPEQVRFASTIYASGNDLLTLINDILDLSRIEAGRLDLKLEEASLASVLGPLQQTFQPIAAQKGLAFDVELRPGAPDALRTDPLRLQQILRNLLANAFKFTEKGRVVLRVIPHGPPGPHGDGRLAFVVEDTGEGIPGDKLEVIFEAFRQADGTTQRRHGGSGLGLTISRQLAHHLGGEISVRSEPGKGSAFTLLLPLSTAAQAPEPGPPPQAQIEVPRERSAGEIDDDRALLSQGAKGERSVLIIEDDRRFAAILRDLAREQRFRCLVANTAAEGVALARRFVPGAALLDMHLPDRSGLSVLEQLKADPQTRHIPIHVVSVADYAQQALELGAVGYALKPVRREQLVAALRRIEEKLTQRLRRVLVVEDNAAQRESIVALLRAEGVEITAIPGVKEAIDHLARVTYDCVVLDLNLPDASGFELLDRMAAGESFSFPPVIVYTGRALSREEELRLRRCAGSVIIKGARSPERLLDEVTLFLHQVEAELPPDKQRLLRQARDRAAALEGRAVLIVEDDVRNVFALTSVLEGHAVKVRVARNGREALEALDRAAADPAAAIDLVLMDIMMPEMDGLTALREIRKREAWRRLPVIALTAKSMPEDRERCLRAGANDYIPKPLDVDKLLSLIKVWMPK